MDHALITNEAGLLRGKKGMLWAIQNNHINLLQGSALKDEEVQ